MKEKDLPVNWYDGIIVFLFQAKSDMVKSRLLRKVVIS